MTKIFIDPGHGGNDSGASSNGLVEKDITLNIALKLQQILNDSYQNVTTRLSRTTDQSVSLTNRTNAANDWNADYYLSIHINAGGGVGFESYIWNGNFASKSETERLRSTIHDEIVETIGWRDRGKKEANFHVLRETTMPAILTENGFIDNDAEAEEMKTPQWIEQVARAHASGIAQAFELEEDSNAEEPDTSSFYRVVTGSFQSEKNAKQRRYVLNRHGYSSFITEFNDQGQVYFRVIVGSFQNRSNAEGRVDELNEIGFDSFISTFNG
ncbi:N-acetylmuramoyl-L-alanine amidase [Paraliobacillus sp. X-1268]|uniref:N-acetylmuramoyl-L-alanine amidase n=1 Tax=Paraliobacillus sp. X-1268 TaxID=2213193 RepID=UPI000E3C3324|nr:N-acetylmuramoyl-L-alanine amidase [Paraliobacillus sp. X-1268]